MKKKLPIFLTLVLVLITILFITFQKRENEKTISFQDNITQTTPNESTLDERTQATTSQFETVLIENIEPINSSSLSSLEVINTESTYTFGAQTLSHEMLNSVLTARQALVNILCLTKPESTFGSISGTGVIIDPRGIILTNAHIAHYFLLEEIEAAGISCVIRQGEPAKTKYDARALYISHLWIDENIEKLLGKKTKSNGKDDFAFLYINESLTDTALPETFTHIDIDLVASNGNLEESDLQLDAPIGIVGYPSEFASPETILDNFLPLFAQSTIKKLYTFDRRTNNALDVISLEGSIVAQRGSSGGALVTDDQTLKGIIANATIGDNLHERTLRAITLGHIERSLKQQTGQTIHKLLELNPETRAQQFKSRHTSIREDLLQLIHQ